MYSILSSIVHQFLHVYTMIIMITEWLHNLHSFSVVYIAVLTII